MSPFLSVVIPTSNEQLWLGGCISSLRAAADLAKVSMEILVVDAHSADGTAQLAKNLGAEHVISCGVRQRAHQMNLGARLAKGQWLWFLHADTLVGPDSISQITRHADAGAGAGWFNVVLQPEHTPALLETFGLELIAAGINQRTSWFHTATGDQGVFMKASVWEELGGFPNQPLLETWEVVRVIKARGVKTVVVDAPLRISARRWERGGLVRTTLKMYAIRAAYLAGVEVDLLAKWWRR